MGIDEFETMDMEVESVQQIVLTYEKKQIAAGEHYTMAIPDCFESFLPGNRDFRVICGSLTTGIEISSSGYIEEELDVEFHLQQTYAEYFGSLYYASAMQSTYERIYGNAEYIASEVGGCIHCLEENLHHFIFMIYVGPGFQQVHMKIYGFEDSPQDITDFAFTLMKGFVLKEPLADFKDFNDPYFVDGLDANKLNEWLALLDLYMGEYAALVHMQMEKERAHVNFMDLSSVKKNRYIQNMIQIIASEQAKRVNALAVQMIDLNERVQLSGLSAEDELHFIEAQERFASSFDTVTIVADKNTRASAKCRECAALRKSFPILKAKFSKEFKQKAHEKFGGYYRSGIQIALKTSLTKKAKDNADLLDYACNEIDPVLGMDEDAEKITDCFHDLKNLYYRYESFRTALNEHSKKLQKLLYKQKYQKESTALKKAKQEADQKQKEVDICKQKIQDVLHEIQDFALKYEEKPSVVFQA
jgi:hypothetical protein